MRIKRIALSSAVAAIALTASLLLITALVSAQSASVIPPPSDRAVFELAPTSKVVKAPSQLISVTFPWGPWPWYAQGEISVHPEPAREGHPTELCAQVVNHDPANVHTATLEFGVADFGIGVPFMPVGAVDLEVPPGGEAQGCVVWVPPAPGPWCIEALVWQPGAPEPERSLRNIIVWEPVTPGQEVQTLFQVGPLDVEGTVSFTLDSPLGWGMRLDPPDFFLPLSTTQEVTLFTQVPTDAVLGSREPAADVEGFLNGESIGGFRKLDMPPVLLHRLHDPFYAESEISISPYPARAGEPTELCVELFNLSNLTQTVEVQFSWASFGIGLSFNPAGPPIVVEIPPRSNVPVCIGWIPPLDGRFCIQVEMNILGDVPYQIQFSQRNIDVGELLEPGLSHTLAFTVGNPLPTPATVTLGLVPHLPDWGLELSQDVLANMDQTEQRVVSLTVTPPTGRLLPPDGTPIVDVEAWANGELLGGFRKIHRPPLVLHRFPEPSYAESEISVLPYPPQAGEPTEVCVELYNPTPWPQDVEIQFSWANFGIGLPFTPIGGSRIVQVPPYSIIRECMHWIPPVRGHVCLQVELFMDGQAPQRSQRNLDVGEPLEPGAAHTLVFSVSNPLDHPANVELGLIPQLDGWEFWLEPNFVPDVGPGETRPVSLTVVPPANRPLPLDGTPIVDVEGFIEGELIGGLRKIHRPRVPLHVFDDPPYAEGEISINPYPAQVGEPTEICVELHNPTPWPQDVDVQFSWANFGIGLPFTPINGRRPVHLPPYSVVRECMHWVPPMSGHVCLQVELFMDGEQPQRSQRNIDVYELLMPGEPHTKIFPVGNPLDHPVDIELGAILHLEGWEVVLDPDSLPGMEPGEVRDVSLTVVPPPGVPLPSDGTVVVDVEAYAEGHLIGGFRKIHRPRVPLHVFPDPPYAESEIAVHPYPAQAGEPTEICVELHNPTDEPQDVLVRFAWANFGVGLPFTPISGMRPVHLPPHSVVNECMHWIPPVSGHMCLQVELFVEGEQVQRSQRNLDVEEPLEPGVSDTLVFPVGNPFDHPVDIELGVVPQLDGWVFGLDPEVLLNMAPGEVREVALMVIPAPEAPLPPDRTVVVDVEAYVEGQLIGGFRKIFRPEVPLHPFPDPVYAEREIEIHPYPVSAGEPAEVCVELRNPTPDPQDVIMQFSWANFGIGLPFTPIPGSLRYVQIPPESVIHECAHWVPPVSGHVCLQVDLFIAGQGQQTSQRNIDVDEPLEPNTSHSRWVPVGNPLDHPATIVLGFTPLLDGWDVRLEPDVLPDMQPGEVREVLLTVTPPDELPPDGTPVVDIEAFVEGELIGGFRKVFRPQVPVHVPGDPVYAEREIHVHPYPPRAQEPTELIVEVRNPTDEWQTVKVLFSVAPFGIGLPFEPVNEPFPVTLPPGGIAHPSTMWLPPEGGLWCIQVEIFIPGHEEPFWSRLNLDVGEPLRPLTPHARPFPVGNPFTEPVSITLGLVPHFPDWGLELSQDVLPDMQPGEVREVILTVTPPADLPADGDPVVDVEAFVDGELMGGFRKIFRPDVPLHRPKDPQYAESEVFIDPYPVFPGVPTVLGVEVFNPTDQDRIVSATFSVAPFGIGLPFAPVDTIAIYVPRHGAARGHVIWEPPPELRGKVCVRVVLEMEGQEPVWSSRNIDVGEPLEPGVPHSLVFPVGSGPYTEPVSITLGLVKHMELWDISLTPTLLENVQPGQEMTATLTVTPPVPSGTFEPPPLGSHDPIVDVEAFVEGELLGGFRKLDEPRVPLDKPHEKGYAESEISIVPYPPRLGQDSIVSTVIYNTSLDTVTVNLEFGWAKFGMGIPFATSGMSPTLRSVTPGPGLTTTASVTWTPVLSGHQCVRVLLSEASGHYEPQESMRNVDVVEEPPCGQPQHYYLTVYNDSPFTETVDVGLITFDVPASWSVTTVPSDTLELGPFSEGTIEIIVVIPCGTLQLTHAIREIRAIQQQAGSVPTVDVEGYIEGELVGGIELQFEPVEPPSTIYLPLILKVNP